MRDAVRGALVVVGGSALLLLLCIAVTAPASRSPERPPPVTVDEGLAAPEAAREAVIRGPATAPVAASGGGVSVSPPGSASGGKPASMTSEGVGASPCAGAAASSPECDAARVTVLPPANEELASDGLPVTALRCASDGGMETCGDCRTASDCAPGLGCVINRETRRMECRASECEEDAHCFPGFVCRAANTGATGPVIRRCAPVGQRRQGEPCDITQTSRASSCGEGLLCIFQVCAVPCKWGDAAGCPEGYACTKGLNGTGCYPDCRARGCPSGQQCRHIEDSIYQCLVAAQGDCREPGHECPAGQHCNMRLSRGRGAFWCAPVCNPLRADSCPDGQVCGTGSDTVSTCFRKCDPEQLESCGEGWRCSTVSEDLAQWGCVRTAAP